MNTPKSTIDREFVEKQREVLLRLRAGLLASTEAAQADEAGVKGQRGGTAVESEEDAQELDALERAENLVARDLERLEQVDRALKKIEEGTYGLSDESGKPIPRDRLEAVPETVYTLSEERAREGKRVR
jgi:DnaK suppressor protein